MREKTLEEELQSILEIEEWESDDDRGVESFKGFVTERIGFGPLVKTGSLLILGRLKHNRESNQRILLERKSTYGLQNLYLGSLMSISISVDTKDKTILRRGKIK